MVFAGEGEEKFLRGRETFCKRFPSPTPPSFLKLLGGRMEKVERERLQSESSRSPCFLYWNGSKAKPP